MSAHALLDSAQPASQRRRLLADVVARVENPDETEEATKMPLILLSSPLDGVSAESWSEFVRVMFSAPVESVSAANAVGAFELRPLRLAELGVLKDIKKITGSAERSIWIGKFIDPRYGARLKRSLSLQYDLFCKSMQDYASKIASGEVKRPLAVSLSGALAILHRAGPGSVATRANGIF